MKTVGVTGSSGHLGNVICRILLENGFRVKAMFNRDDRALEGLSVERIQGDILNPEDVEHLVRECDYVIHSAAIISIHGDPEGMVFRTNTQGPVLVLEACIRNGIKRLIHISSTHAVMEEPLSTPFDENRPYKKQEHFAYDFSKSTGEQHMLKAFREGSINGIVVRPSAVTGPYDFKPSELGKALLDFYNRKIPVLPPGGYNFVDVRDVAGAIVSGLENGASGEVYLGSGKYYTLRELAATVTEVTGIKTPKMKLPFWLMYLLLPFVKLYGKLSGAAPVFTKESITALKLGHPDMRNDKAVKDLKMTCRPLSETLLDFYTWQKERGVIK